MPQICVVFGYLIDMPLLLHLDTSPLRSSLVAAACSMKALFIDLDGPMFQYQPICNQDTSDAVSWDQ